VWEISISVPGASILIEFNEPYGIYGSQPCEMDYVQVYGGESVTGSFAEKHCDFVKPENIVVGSKTVTVEFHRSSLSQETNRPGISVSYRAIINLPFLALSSNSQRVPPVDDGVSAPITVDQGFPLGCSLKSTVYVGTNGYFTFSTFTGYTPFQFTGASGLSLVAPFFTDIDISHGNGKIIYKIFDFSSPVAGIINYVIRFNKHTNFTGEWFLVAEWRDVAHNNHHQFQTLTFQGILATDFQRSYAIFIYSCDDVIFTIPSAIGFVTSDGMYANYRSVDFLQASCLLYYYSVIYEISGTVDECS
jgi:hypothetical protein